MADDETRPGRQAPPAVGPNEVLRFALELGALAAFAYAGWRLPESTMVSGILATGLPLLAAAAWGTFRVDGDPGRAPVPVPGLVRLCIEADFFTAAVILLAVAGQPEVAFGFAVLVVVHYALGRRRVRWLIGHPGRVRA